MKKALIFIGLVALIFLAMNLIRIEDAPDPAGAMQQNCQYEGRLYPDGSCDNSDPCDPETLKDPVLRGDCRSAKPADPIVVPEIETIQEEVIMLEGGK